MLCPILWISHTIFLVGLLFDREIGWIGQVRDDHAVPFRLALATLWPQTLIGWVAIALVSATQPAALPYVLFLAAGPALAIPFAMLTAWRSLGSLAVQIGIGRLPEETATPHELLLLSLPAISTAAQPAASRPGVAMFGVVRTARATVRVLAHLLRQQGAGRGNGSALSRVHPAR